MRYVPVASPAYIKRYLPDGFTARAAAEAPSLAWNRDDALQDMLVRKVFRRDIKRPQHFVPTAEGFGAAVLAGLGWGIFPDSLASPRLGDGSFVQVSEAHLDVPLYWQCWKLDSPMVKKITDAVTSAAASGSQGKWLIDRSDQHLRMPTTPPPRCSCSPRFHA
jgi:LysR family transcriptional regulator, chromosome initiation inhibitor